MKFLTIKIPQDIEREIIYGNIKKATFLIKEKLRKLKIPFLCKRLEYELERIARLNFVFPYSYKTAFRKASHYIKKLTQPEFKTLVEREFCDYIYINGKKRFEKRFYYNIPFLDKEYSKRAQKNQCRVKAKKYLENRLKELISGAAPKNYKICVRFAITPGINKNVRVWLPIVKKSFQINEVKIRKILPSNAYIASPYAPQRTVYFKGSGQKTYSIIYEYKVAEWLKGRFYFKESKGKLLTYLKEQPPHMIFSYPLVELSKKIVGKEKNSYKRALKIYDWITTNIKYSFVRPYMFYDNIPQWVLTNMRGDCGFQALLFITLARICSVPAKWQSGWYVNPYFQGPHDWAVFYTEEYGWLPCDLSFGGARRENEKLRRFYFGNLDGFRAVFNDEFMSEFYPLKKNFRSDPYDNQVGEVETSVKNIYDFKYKFEVLDFKEVL